MAEINRDLELLNQTVKETINIFDGLLGSYGRFLSEHGKIVTEQIVANEKATDRVKKNTKKVETAADRQKKLYESELKRRGYILDQDGKEVDETTKLHKSQEDYLEILDKQIQKEENLQRALADPVKTFRDIASSTNSASAIFNKLETELFDKVGKKIGTTGVASMQLFVDAGKGFVTGLSAMAESLWAGDRGAKAAVKGTTAVGDAISKTLYGIAAAMATLPLGPLFKIAAVGVTLVAAAVQTYTKMLEKAAEVNDKLFDSYNKLSQIGAGTAKGMTGVYETVQKVGLTTGEIDKFNALITDNSKNLALFGGTVSKGAEFYAEVANKIAAPDSKINKELMMLGITADQQREGIMKYMAEETRLGLLKNQSQDQIIRNGRLYLEKLDRITMLTGATRKEQEEARAAITANDELRAAIVEAEQDDTEEGRKRLGQLKRAMEAAALLRQKGDIAGATGVAKYAAAGGIAGKESATAYQTFGGQGGLLDVVKEGGSETDMVMAISKGYKRQLDVIGPTVAIAGFQAGSDYITANIGTAVDTVTAANEVIETAQAKGMTPEEYVQAEQKSRKASEDERTKLNVDTQQIQQQAAQNIDKALMSMLKSGGGTKILNAAAKSLDVSVRTFRTVVGLGGAPATPPVPSTPSSAPAAGGVSTGARAPQVEERTSTASGTAKPAGSLDKLLNLIAKYESGGDYNILVGGKRANLTDMTVAEVLQFQNQMLVNGHETTAVGKYQIIKKTLLGALKPAGVSMEDKFDASTQDKLAIALLQRRGLDKYLGKKIDADTFADNLSKEWASLPYNTGKSFYAGVGSNASHVPRADLINSLPSANTGGYFEGPKDGYFVQLHGTEFVGNEKQIAQIKKLLDIADENNLLSDSSATSSSAEDDITHEVVANFASMMESKVDELAEKFRRGNSTDENILNYSR